jgi:hypothetical protein
MPNKCSKNLHIQVASVHYLFIYLFIYLFMYFHNKDDMGAMVGRGALVPVGKGIGLSSPTGTNDERQKAPFSPG